jgi:uncharacterized protein YbjT (DUF2867 family)
MPILVTGATGNIGEQVVAELLRRGRDVRAFTRDPERAAAKLGRGIEIVAGDFADPATVRAAMQGMELLVLSSSNHPAQAQHEATVIDEAARAGVQHIVKLSTMLAEVGSRLAFFDAHGRAEQHLRRSGLPHVIIQSSFYMTNLFAVAQSVRAMKKLFAPLAGARISMIDPRDVAAVAVAALVTDRFDGQALQLTGPEAITYEHVAEVLSEVTHSRVEFIPVSDDVARQNLLASGIPDWFAEQIVVLFGLLRAGVGSAITDTVQAVTGSAPRDFGQFAADFGAVFQSAGSEALVR